MQEKIGKIRRISVDEQKRNKNQFEFRSGKCEKMPSWLHPIKFMKVLKLKPKHVVMLSTGLVN